MNTESHSPAVDRYPDPFIVSFVLTNSSAQTFHDNQPTDRPLSRSIHRNPPHPTPGISSYRYQSTHSPAAGHYPDPSFDPGAVSTRRVLSRAVQSSMQPPTPPHAIHDCPSPSPHPAKPWWSGSSLIVDTLGSGSLQNPGPRPSVCMLSDWHSFIYWPDYRTGLCTRVTKPLRNLRGNEPVCSTSKEVDGLSFVSACLGHAGVNFRRWAAKSEVTGFQLDPLPSQIPLDRSRNGMHLF